jgi:hypothetical protein
VKFWKHEVRDENGAVQMGMITEDPENTRRVGQEMTVTTTAVDLEPEFAEAWKDRPLTADELASFEELRTLEGLARMTWPDIEKAAKAGNNAAMRYLRQNTQPK